MATARKSVNRGNPAIDMLGQKSGSFVVVARVLAGGALQWKVRCRCGFEMIRHGSWLRACAKRGHELYCPNCGTGSNHRLNAGRKVRSLPVIGRERGAAARTISERHVDRRELEREHIELAEWIEIAELSRPRTRGDCEFGIRPCPYVGCRYNLYLDVSEKTGSLKLNHPDREVTELEQTCSLDVADEGGTTLEGVAMAMNLTRERTRQIELQAATKLRQRGGLDAWHDHAAKDYTPAIARAGLERA